MRSAAAVVSSATVLHAGWTPVPPTRALGRRPRLLVPPAPLAFLGSIHNRREDGEAAQRWISFPRRRILRMSSLDSYASLFLSNPTMGNDLG